MRIGLVGPEVPGHLNPLTTLGTELSRRGHDVVFFGTSLAVDHFREVGLPFKQLGADDPRVERLRREFRVLGGRTGTRGMVQTGRIFGLTSRIILEHLPAACQQELVDGFVIDQLSAAAAEVAERRSLPYVVACCALAMHWDPFVPPPALLWRYRTGVLGRLRNQVARRLVPALYGRLVARGTGVHPLRLVLDERRGLAQIAQQPAFFELPHVRYPAHLHYTGPWHDPDRDDATPFPWERLDDRPLLYASMGTLQNAVAGVFDAIMEAVAELDVQVVLTRGGGTAALSRPPPANVVLVDRAPQLRLLERTELAITHAGLNTVLECLGRGVPMLCLPVTNDQPGVARRVEWLGAGRLLPVRRASAKQIRSELEALLGDGSYGTEAQICRDRLAGIRGVSRAVDIVEEALRTGRRVLAR